MELTVFELVYYFDLFDWKENEMHCGLWLLLYLIPMFILFLLLVCSLVLLIFCLFLRRNLFKEKQGRNLLLAIFWLGLFNLLLNLLV